MVPPVQNRERQERFRAETGRPGSIMGFFEGSDWLCESVIRFSVQLNTHVMIDPDLTDQVGLVVSQDNSCRFCFGAQRVFLRAMGMTETRIHRLEQSLLIRDLPPRDERALAFARRLSRSQPLIRPDEMHELLEAGIPKEEAAELAGHVALHMFFNRLSTFVAVPPGRVEAMPDRWWMSFARPFMRRWAVNMRKHGRPTPLEATGDEPFAEVVGVLDGLPMARDFRDAIDRCFASRAISPLSGPLVFAVVARALGCEASEQEAGRVLEDRGMAPASVRSMLTNLSAPEASPIDETVAAFARETVWYVPAQIQRRCQALRSEFSREQLLDLMGAASLANSVCRLAAIAGCEAR